MRNPTVSSVPTLEDLVAHLERQNRRLLVAILIACSMLAFSVDLGVRAARDAPTVLEARHFILKAADGSKRGEWRVDEEGNGRFVLRGPDGQTVGELPFRKQLLPLGR